MNLQLEIGFRQTNSKIVDLIKYHAFKIKNYLDHLTELVKDDADLAKGIRDLHFEALFNLNNFILENIPELSKKIGKKSVKKPKESIHISAHLADKLQKEKQKRLVKS